MVNTNKRIGLWISAIFFIISLGILSGCSSDSKATTKEKAFTIGFTPGPYNEHFQKGVLPALEKQGYKVKIVEFNSPNEANPALTNGSIDANIFQSTAFMESYAEENKVKLNAVTQVPSAPQGLYSEKHKKIEDVKDGMKIGVPNDPVNMERALRIIEDLGWIKLNPNLKLLTISEKDISPADYDLKFVPIESPQIPRSMQDLDYAIINGNLAIDSGRKLTDAFVLEDTPPEHRIIFTVRDEDKDAPFAQAVKKAFQSKEFKDYFDSQKKYKGFVLPDYMR